MNNGLDDVLATETTLSDVDGAAGALIIRGRSLDELAGLDRYEDVLQLLLDGFFSDLPGAGGLAAALGRARRHAFQLVSAQDERLFRLPVIDAMRALMAQIDDGDNLAAALNLIAAPAVFTPAIIRLKRGEAPIAPDASAGHAKDVLHMLHGGAPGPVLDMLDAIGRAEDAEAWLEKALDRGDRLMGFGHRIYKVRDPRADALMRAVRKLAASRRDNGGRIALAEAVEAAAVRILARRKPDRSLKTNVEFYTAVLLEALGFPRESFTCVFAMGRVGGWVGHAREQALYGRLIRPQSRYIGPRPDQAA